MPIIQHPRLFLLEDWYRFRLEEDWIYAWEHDGSVRSLTVPAGLVTDLASVPRVARLWIDRHEIRAASIPHDYIYGYAGRIPAPLFTINGEPSTECWSRRDTDRLFARIMRESGVEKAKRRAAYAAVRIWGWGIWGRAERTIMRETAVA